MTVRDVWNIVREDVIAADVYTAFMMVLYIILSVVLHDHVHGAMTVIWTNVLVLALISGSIVLVRLTGSAAITFVRYFYIVPAIYMMYDQTHLFVAPINPHLYDDLLIRADRMLFGIDPTVWLQRHAFPALTEFLQICYFLFYLMPVTHALDLWFRGDVDRVIHFARLMSFVFFVSYLLYFALPAIGPRFTLHDFSALNNELPGVWLTETLRSIVNIGGGVVSGTADPASVVNRDCMPSGHTMLTLVNIILAFRNRSRFRYLFLVLGSGLIFATVYLRYHYVIDLIVGALLVILCIPLESHVDKYIRKATQR
ncbi:MAG: phosphatase PAP2 family protein [Candidatus Kapabacteria bacterium]|nr:phosphatase PAP2 family protein [Candidatus Kapabacteria bacterium]